MITTHETAVDQICKVAHTCIAGEVTAYLGSAPQTLWPMSFQAVPPASDKIWLRVSTQEVDSEQDSLGNAVAGSGLRMFSSYGLCFIELYVPMSAARAGEKARHVAQLLRNTFRHVSAGEKIVVFRNARINDNIPPENSMYRVNVVVEYEYSEIN